MAKDRLLACFCCLSLFLLPGCLKQPPTGESGYFSTKDFVIDQRKFWVGSPEDNWRGTPKTLRQVTTLNGKTDSMFIDIRAVDWHAIFSMFAAADIRDTAFADQYRFSDFDDSTLGLRANTYDAIDPKLFTRRLQFTTNPETNRIYSVYVETADETGARKRWQKLYYGVDKLLQIEEHEEPALGKARNLLVEYYFEYD